MTPLEIAAVLLASVAAGAINTVVGSGTLITFPTLLATGVPPVSANVSNALGLVPGSVTGAVGYRRELGGQRERALRLVAAMSLGAVTGAVLLLVLPPGIFVTVVPVLIGLGVVLVLAQPRISVAVAARRPESRWHQVHGARWVWPLIGLIGVYGGYFGAAQGVLLMAILGAGIPDALQRLNGLKNVLAALGNGVAGVVFVAVAPDQVDWLAVVLVAVGATGGGLLGAVWGRRIPPAVLRGVIAVVGVVAAVALVV